MNRSDWDYWMDECHSVIDLDLGFDSTCLLEREEWVSTERWKGLKKDWVVLRRKHEH